MPEAHPDDEFTQGLRVLPSPISICWLFAAEGGHGMALTHEAVMPADLGVIICGTPTGGVNTTNSGDRTAPLATNGHTSVVARSCRLAQERG